MTQGQILVVDDEKQIGQLVQRSLTKAGHQVTYRDQPEEALRLLKDEAFDVVVTDLRMPGIDGLEFLTRSKKIRPECEVLLMTGYATVETALEALKRGAIDYITKPFSVERDLVPVIEKILNAPSESPEGEDSAPLVHEPVEGEEHIVAESEEMRLLVDKARRIARAPSTVLLTGESGTGKEIFANLIHQESDRKNRDLVSVNCAALPDTLLESELFGHCKGAFTGATSDRQGYFEVADGGTIFLDEIGEISANFQPKLLRVLESGEFHRVGDSNRLLRVDVRVIAATNRKLAEAVKSGQFREDLYYRLNVLPLHLPPLRERPEDVPALLNFFLRRRSSKHHFNKECLEALTRYNWPGNIRELVNAVEHAVVLSQTEMIDMRELPSAIQDFQQSAEAKSQTALSGSENTLEEIEINCIMQAMEKTEFNRTQAARLLGVSRRTLGYRIEKYDLGQALSINRASP